MAQKVIIDTDILIDFAFDDSDAVQTMAELEQNFEMAVSIITAMELFVGCRSKKDLQEVENLLSNFEIFHVTRAISEQSFIWMKEYRSSQGVDINDMLIASTAFLLEAPMISKNQKHYTFLPGLHLLEYPHRGV